MNIGLLGGSFDPPHLAHLFAAVWTLATHPIEQVWFVPCFAHAFGKPLVASFDHRVEMCRLTIALLGAHARVEMIERELAASGGPNYTIDTVAALQKLHPDDRFHLLLGSDLLSETREWKDFDRLKALAPCIIIPRLPAPNDESQSQPPPEEAPAYLPAMSSTLIRGRLRRGLPLKGWLARDVEQYIRSHGLYRPSEGERTL